MDWLSFIVEETKSVTGLVKAATTFLLACLAVHVIRRRGTQVARLLDRITSIKIARDGISAGFVPPEPVPMLLLLDGDSDASVWKGFAHRDIKAANVLIAPHHGSINGFLWYL